MRRRVGRGERREAEGDCLTEHHDRREAHPSKKRKDRPGRGARALPDSCRILGQNPALGAAAAVRRPDVAPWEIFLEHVHVSYPDPCRVQQHMVPQEESENKHLRIGREETEGVEGYKRTTMAPGDRLNPRSLPYSPSAFWQIICISCSLGFPTCKIAIITPFSAVVMNTKQDTM